MKLINQIVEKKLIKFDEEFTNNKNNFWDLYQAINLVNSVIPQKINKNVRNELWKKVLKNNEKAVLQMRTLVYKDRAKTYGFLSELMAKEEKETQFGNIYKKGRIAVLDYEYA